MAHLGARYAHLADIDNTGVEIYETPELTDDTSTVRDTSTNRSRSQSDTSEVLTENFDRTHIQADKARSRFLPSRVDARGVDFSDRLNERRKTYKSVPRVRRRDREVITTEDEDEDVWSDDEPSETLARKLARLTREVEEVKAEYARQHINEREQASKDAGTVIESLGKALDGVRLSQREAVSAHGRMMKQLSQPNRAREQYTPTQPPSVPARVTSDEDDVQIMAQLADFESRLADLERGLGLTSMDPASSVTPLLPKIAALDRQVSFLTSSDAKPYLESLAAETSALNQGPAADEKPDPAREDARGSDMQDPTAQQLQSLVALLPTLTSQSEIVPHLLTRLSTLRHVHAGAERAGTTLREIEERQTETDAEIKHWRQGLEKVEAAVRAAEDGLRVNVGTVEEWVRDLEAKVKAATGQKQV